MRWSKSTVLLLLGVSCSAYADYPEKAASIEIINNTANYNLANCRMSDFGKIRIALHNQNANYSYIKLINIPSTFDHDMIKHCGVGHQSNCIDNSFDDVTDSGQEVFNAPASYSPYFIQTSDTYWDRYANEKMLLISFKNYNPDGNKISDDDYVEQFNAFTVSSTTNNQLSVLNSSRDRRVTVINATGEDLTIDELKQDRNSFSKFEHTLSNGDTLQKGKSFSITMGNRGFLKGVGFVLSVKSKDAQDSYSFTYDDPAVGPTKIHPDKAQQQHLSANLSDDKLTVTIKKADSYFYDEYQRYIQAPIGFDKFEGFIAPGGALSLAYRQLPEESQNIECDLADVNGSIMSPKVTIGAVIDNLLIAHPITPKNSPVAVFCELKAGNPQYSTVQYVCTIEPNI